MFQVSDLFSGSIVSVVDVVLFLCLAGDASDAIAAHRLNSEEKKRLCMSLITDLSN